MRIRGGSSGRGVNCQPTIMVMPASFSCELSAVFVTPASAPLHVGYLLMLIMLRPMKFVFDVITADSTVTLMCDIS